MSSPRKKATKKAVESDSEGRPSRTKRAPARLDPSSDVGEVSGSDTPKRGGSRRRSVSVERKKKRGPGRPRKTTTRAKSPARTTRKRRRSVDTEREYEVEQILDVQFLVKWKGYAKSSATWEPLKNLQTCDDMVVAYIDKVKERLLETAEERKSTEEAGDEQEEKVATPKKRGRPSKKAKAAENDKEDKAQEADQ